tara:strand:+ start:46391 stop:46609 length:219 start_codon:yes stop_codon:yes gene_type:complete
MKVTQEEKEFKPVTIVLESQAEVDALLICLNVDGKAFKSARDALGSTISDDREESAKTKQFSMWRLVQALYK